jgi:hypothetical protein
MDNKQSQFLMAQIHLMEAMLGSLMATHPNPDSLKAEFSNAKDLFLKNMQSKGYSKEVVSVTEKNFDRMLNHIGKTIK